MAGKMLTELQSINSVKYGRYADIGWLYLHTISDTVDWKPDLRKNGNLLLSAIADSSYLYSGMSETLYEYAFDTILPKYTPLFEEELISKQASANVEIETPPFVIYPNPTSNFINIKLSSGELEGEILDFLKHYDIDCTIIEINIYDINSRLVNMGKYNYDALISIDVGEYSSGTYIVEIRSCWGRVIQTKVIKI